LHIGPITLVSPVSTVVSVGPLTEPEFPVLPVDPFAPVLSVGPTCTCRFSLKTHYILIYKYLDNIYKKNDFLNSMNKFIYSFSMFRLIKLIYGFFPSHIQDINNTSILPEVCQLENINNTSILPEPASNVQNSNNISILPELEYDDFDVMLELVKQNGLLLIYASDILKQNHAIVLAAVTQNGMAIKIVYDYEIVYHEGYNYSDGRNNDNLRTYSEAREIIDDTRQNLVDNEQIVSTAVAQNGYAFEFISERLKQNREIARIAVKQNGRSFKFIESDRLISDKDLILDALVNTTRALPHIPYELRSKFNNVIKNATKGNMKYFYKKIIDGTIPLYAKLWVKLLKPDKRQELIIWIKTNKSNYESLFEVLFYKCKNYNSQTRIGYLGPVRDILLSYLESPCKHKMILDDISRACSIY